MSHKIYIFKMVSGEEVIGTVVNELTTEEGYVSINKPRAVHMIPTREGVGLQLLPFIQVDPDCTVEVSFKDMLAKPIKASADIASAYLRATSSLDLPPTATGSILHS